MKWRQKLVDESVDSHYWQSSILRISDDIFSYINSSHRLKVYAHILQIVSSFSLTRRTHKPFLVLLPFYFRFFSLFLRVVVQFYLFSNENNCSRRRMEIGVSLSVSEQSGTFLSSNFFHETLSLSRERNVFFERCLASNIIPRRRVFLRSFFFFWLTSSPLVESSTI